MFDGDAGLGATANNANGRWRHHHNHRRLRFGIFDPEHQFHYLGRREGPQIFATGVLREHIEREVSALFDGFEHFGLFRSEFEGQFELFSRL